MVVESCRLPWQGEQSKGKIYLIFGPEGSGKSTQAKLLSENTGLPHVEFGDAFREVAQEDTELGRKCKSLVTTRTFASFDIYQEVFRHKFTRKTEGVDLYKNGMILDGAVRTDEQVGAFIELLESTDRVMPIYSVYFKTPVWLSFKRQEERKRADSKTPDKILRALTNHYQGLGKRMNEVAKISNLTIVPVRELQTPEMVHEETLKKLKLTK